MGLHSDDHRRSSSAREIHGRWDTNLSIIFGLCLSPLAFVLIHQYQISTVRRPATVFLAPISHTVSRPLYPTHSGPPLLIPPSFFLYSFRQGAPSWLIHDRSGHLVSRSRAEKRLDVNDGYRVLMGHPCYRLRPGVETGWWLLRRISLNPSDSNIARVCHPSSNSWFYYHLSKLPITYYNNWISILSSFISSSRMLNTYQFPLYWIRIVRRKY